jgi:uncharacterized protein (TIRG00374 family)
MAKKLISLLVSLGILAAIYLKLDFTAITKILFASDIFWVVMAILMFIPTTLASSWRFSYLAPERTIPLGLSIRLFLSAGSLNLVLPSKMGDVLKLFFIRKKVELSDPVLLCLVVFEKSLDMAALCVLCLVGILLRPSDDPLVWLMFAGNLGLVILIGLLVFSPRAAGLIFSLFSRLPKIGEKFQSLGQSWGELQAYLAGIPGGRVVAAFTSVGIWMLHLVQIWLFMLALGLEVGFVLNMALTPLAIFIGLLPMSLAGIGTRDAALIYFYLPFFSPASAAALGMYCTLRYILPAILGLPFVFGFTRDMKLSSLKDFGKA